MYDYFVNVLKRNDRLADGSSRLMLDVRINGERKRIALNVCVMEDEWDEVRKVVKAGKSLAKQRNMIIQKALHNARRILYDSEIKGEPMTMQMFVRDYSGRRVVGNFVEFVGEQIELAELELSAETIKNYRKFYNRLADWKAVIPFQLLREELIEEWHRHLLSFGNAVNTINHYHKLFKKFLAMARRKGKIEGDPYENFTNKKQKTSKTFLTDEEVQVLIDEYTRWKTSDERRKILRHFLFMCFTGLRYSDLKLMELKNLHGRELIFSPEKTKRSLGEIVVPLNEFALRLIREERMMGDVELGVRLFRVISNQKMNKQLKAICVDAAIRKNVSCHVARHTFATLFLAAGNNIEVLQKILGHSEIKTTMEYRHIMRREKVEGLKRMDNLFVFN